jgi:hypothetical protein
MLERVRRPSFVTTKKEAEGHLWFVLFYGKVTMPNDSYVLLLSLMRFLCFIYKLEGEFMIKNHL